MPPASKFKHGVFTRMQLKSWRNFGAVDVVLTSRVFVVGANATGKSNFLDVFRFLKDLASDGGGLTNALHGENRGGIKAIRSLFSRSNPTVSIEADCKIDDQTWRYLLILTVAKDVAQVHQERVHCDNKKLYDSQDIDSDDPELQLATALEQPSLNHDFRKLRAFFQSVEYIHVVPQLVRRPTRDDDRFGKGLGSQLIGVIADTPERECKRRLKRIEKALKSVVPQFSELEIHRDKKTGVPHLRAKFEHWRPNGGWQDESSFSDGTLRLLGLLWYLLDGSGPLLLEEPEISLHSEIVWRLPGIIAILNERTARQVIITSHSQEMLNDPGIAPNEVVLLERDAKGPTTARLGSDDDGLVDASNREMPLGDLLRQRTRAKGADRFAAALQGF
jgi:predicted ATPase